MFIRGYYLIMLYLIIDIMKYSKIIFFLFQDFIYFNYCNQDRKFKFNRQSGILFQGIHLLPSAEYRVYILFWFPQIIF